MAPVSVIFNGQTLAKLKVAFCCKLPRKYLQTIGHIVLASLCLSSLASGLPGASLSLDSDHTKLSNRLQVATNGQNLKLAKIVLSGSMCPACLKHLSEKLTALGGVSQIEIIAKRAKTTSFTRKNEIQPKHKLASLKLVFDQKRIDKRQIVEAIKHSDLDVLSFSSHKYRPEQVH